MRRKDALARAEAQERYEEEIEAELRRREEEEVVTFLLVLLALFLLLLASSPHFLLSFHSALNSSSSPFIPFSVVSSSEFR